MKKEKVIENGIEYKVKIDVDGAKAWYLNDRLHREDGPAIEWADGNKYWYLNDQLHREDGPAVEWADGSKQWYLNGQRHREDGPAIEWADGSKEWWLNNKKYTEQEYWIEIENRKPRSIKLPRFQQIARNNEKNY